MSPKNSSTKQRGGSDCSGSCARLPSLPWGASSGEWWRRGSSSGATSGCHEKGLSATKRARPRRSSSAFTSSPRILEIVLRYSTSAAMLHLTASCNLFSSCSPWPNMRIIDPSSEAPLSPFSLAASRAPASTAINRTSRAASSTTEALSCAAAMYSSSASVSRAKRPSSTWPISSPKRRRKSRRLAVARAVAGETVAFSSEYSKES
mmetsp:Transcript_67848/g.201929  ORF Transcript_67848/g.201929 Transcript_67848/m.201929 type:complete len:206 (-) Transcript_67848:65-682(-)